MYATSSNHCSTGIGIGGIKRSRSSRVIGVVLFYFVFLSSSKNKDVSKTAAYGSFQGRDQMNENFEITGDFQNL